MVKPLMNKYTAMRPKMQEVSCIREIYEYF
jgi:hypothetical protein